RQRRPARRTRHRLDCPATAEEKPRPRHPPRSGMGRAVVWSSGWGLLVKHLPVRLPFKSAAVRAISGDSVLGRAVSTAFHVHWHYSGAWTKNTYLGYPIQQSPFDMHAYQELIFRVRPEFIVQTGVAYGGSLL